MKLNSLTIMIIGGMMATGCHTDDLDNFEYAGEKFADIQMLRYKADGFENLSLQQKELIYNLQEAALYGRDILFDQNGAYNLRIRKMLETVYTDFKGNREGNDFKGLTEYLKRVWFSSGIHHHYGSTKFVPEFSETFFRDALKSVDSQKLPLQAGQTVDELCNEVFPVIFDPSIMPMRVNQKDGDDLITTSSENYYGPGITQAEAEAFYAKMSAKDDTEPVLYGLNSRLIKKDGVIMEQKWCTEGLYGESLKKIVEWLEKAKPFAENEAQKKEIELLIDYYRTGDLKTFDEYNITWVQNTENMVDFVNGFIEVYGDPIGIKGSWESIVNYKNLTATERTEKMSNNAQWFEDHSPIDPQFKKEECKGISAKVITAAILAGNLYPSTAIGINLPNSNWIRKEYGSKSVTIGNFTETYAKTSLGNGFNKEFVIDASTLNMIDKYVSICEELHVDLHECLGHGSGKLLPGVSSDSLRAYGSTIEEARADLFALYYLADPKLIELGLTPNDEAYKSYYYTYIMNGLLTQIVRIKLGENIEEAHMRNRALIARWVYEKGQKDNVVELVKKDGKTYVKINDYKALRTLFGNLLSEIQRIKSTGDFKGARQLVENYGVKIDPTLHKEVLKRYEALNITPYKGFINPKYELVKDESGKVIDVKVSYDESYEEQMLRYSKDYSTLPYIN